MLEQRTRAKAAWKGSGDADTHGDFKELLEKFGENKFVGYEQTKASSKVLALLDENYKHADTLSNNSKGWVLLDYTPFYAESGGQVGDCGEIERYAKVTNTKKFFKTSFNQNINILPMNSNDFINPVFRINDSIPLRIWSYPIPRLWILPICKFYSSHS